MRKKLITLCLISILCASQPAFGSDDEGPCIVRQNNPYAAQVIPQESEWDRINQQRKMVIKQWKYVRQQALLRQQQTALNNLITRISETPLEDDKTHNTLHMQMFDLHAQIPHTYLTPDQKRIMVQHEMPLPRGFILNIGAWPEYDQLVVQKRTRGETRGERILDNKKIICYEIVTRFYEVTQQPMWRVETLIGWSNVLGRAEYNVEAFGKALEAYEFCEKYVTIKETDRRKVVDDFYHKQGTALLKMIDFVFFTRHEDSPKIELQKFAKFDLFLREYKFTYMPGDSKQKLSTIFQLLSPETKIAVEKFVDTHQ